MKHTNGSAESVGGAPSESTMSAMCKPQKFAGNARLQACKIACEGNEACVLFCHKECVNDCLDIKTACVLVDDQQRCEGHFTECRIRSCNWNPQDGQFNGNQTLSDKADIVERNLASSTPSANKETCTCPSSNTAAVVAAVNAAASNSA